MAKTVKVKKEEKEVVPTYKFTLTIENNSFTGEDVDALKALKAIPVPELISTGTLTVTHGDKSKDMLFPGQQLKRLFNIYHQDVLINDLVAGL